MQPANLPVMRTRLKADHRVVRQMPARLSPAKRKIVHDWVSTMVLAGLYTRCDNNSWASRVTVVPKADGSFRCCGNYVEVNKQCESDAGPMPDHRQKMSTFRGCRLFATFDMENGYLQGELDDLGSAVFAVVTEDGTFCPKRVPFGVKNAPVWFHNGVARIAAGVPLCETIFDDACIGGYDLEEFTANLAAFLDTVIANNIKLKARKAHIGVTQVRFVGRIIDGDTVRIDTERCESLVHAAHLARRRSSAATSARSTG